MAEFHPAEFLQHAGGKGKKTGAGLIVLNQKIESYQLLSKAWQSTDFHICADGGANRLYDVHNSDEERRKWLPDLITGDLDSLRDNVRAYYSDLGVTVIEDKDQYATDFMKSVRALKDLADIKTIYAFGAMGGRVDQEFHSIHHLYLSRDQGQVLYLISDQSVSFLVPPLTAVTINTPLEHLGETCGIIPLEGSTLISTTGLRWDVSDWETSFATKMSTSNHLINPQVTLTTNKTVLFTAELRNYAGN